MPETEYTQENLASIRTKIENIEQLVRFEIAANPNSEAAVRRHLQDRPGAADVYLALCKAPQSQEELAASLNLSQPTVSRVCAHLMERGLLVKLPDPRASGKRQMVYAPSGLEQIVGVSRIAREVIGSGPPAKNRSPNPGP